MYKLFTITACILFSVVYISAQESLSLTFKHQANGQDITINESEFFIWNNKAVMLTRAEFYLSQVSLKNTGGDSLPFNQTYVLVDALKPDSVYMVGEVNSMNADKIQMFVGVDAEANHLDPASYDASHPLAYREPSMHWGWSAGYRFMAIEGFIDNNADGIPESLFQFHNLSDALYKSVELTLPTDMSFGEPLEITLDYTQLFDKMNLNGNLLQHGGGTQNKAMMANATTKGFFTIEGVSATEDQQVDKLFDMSVLQKGNTLVVNFKNQHVDRLIITDVQGQTLINQPINNVLMPQELSIGNLPVGNMYFVTAIQANKIVGSKKLIIH